MMSTGAQVEEWRARTITVVRPPVVKLKPPESEVPLPSVSIATMAPTALRAGSTDVLKVNIAENMTLNSKEMA